jgi:integrase
MAVQPKRSVFSYQVVAKPPLTHVLEATMARPKKAEPDYCLDRSSGRGYVCLNGHRVYLGKHGTEESKCEYRRVLNEWIQAGRQTVPTKSDTKVDAGGGVTISQLIAAFWTFARDEYPDPNYREGKRPAGELGNYWDVLRPLRRLYGPTAIKDYGPNALKATREEMIRLGWCRNVVNRQVSRIKRVFSWAAEAEYPDIDHNLFRVKGFRRGRGKVRETEPVKPVAESHAKAIFDHLSPQLQALISLQLFTGMRPNEACTMRGCEIETGGRTWTYRPTQHKNAHRGKGYERVIDLGPQAKAIIQKYLKPDLSAYLFSPAEAAEARRQLRAEARTTPDSCGNSPGKNRKTNPERSPSDHYTRTTYRCAITRACSRAFPPPKRLARQRVQANGRKTRSTRWETRHEWRTRLGAEAWAELQAWEKLHRFHPHQLRHSAATRWRKDFGSEAALVLLGDKSAAMLNIYAEQDRQLATDIAAKTG